MEYKRKKNSINKLTLITQFPVQKYKHKKQSFVYFANL